ncbi:MAG: hypothetical protein OXU77_03770 [Gammaproteobacteria bacterium]|nr:hypothetical protein [Gammaproteobacteria bacterium]
MAQRVAIESWDPDYGVPSTEHTEETDVEIDVGVEVPEDRWGPIPARTEQRPEALLFIDGVRRIDANAWLDDGRIPVRQGMFASFAAGAVRVVEQAHVDRVEVRRTLFAPGNPEAFVTRGGTYEPFGVATPGADALSSALQERLGDLEVEVASRVADNADLVVVDGPLYRRAHLPRTIGYVKTHRVQHLKGRPAETIAVLAAGERTPVFRFRTSWTRHAWYLRLPGPKAHAWSGVVRMEATADLALDETLAMANLTAGVLPRYASEPHKDPRAPQNLYPIAGLERELRRRLGDAVYVDRALRAAAG